MDLNVSKSNMVYLDSMILMDRVYKCFLNNIKLYLKKINIQDINNIQALIIYQIGTDKLTAGDLISYGYYTGTNAAYNIKKISQKNYIEQEKSGFDKRSKTIFLTKKGLTLFDNLSTFVEECSYMLTNKGFDGVSMQDNLKKLENFLMAGYSHDD